MRFIISLFFAACASAQVISVGIKGGVPLTQAFVANTDLALAGFFDLSPQNCAVCDGQSATQRTIPYIIGPALEIRLFRAFRVDIEGLYSRSIYDFTSKYSTPSSGVHVIESKHAISRWEFPLLVKFGGNAWRGVHPFASAGVSVRYDRDYTVGGLLGGRNLSFAVINAFSGGSSTRSTVVGPTFAVGANVGASRIRPSFELRYTHWMEQPISEDQKPYNFVFGANTALHSTQNQAQFLVGLMF